MRAWLVILMIFLVMVLTRPQPLFAQTMRELDIPSFPSTIPATYGITSYVVPKNGGPTPGALVGTAYEASITNATTNLGLSFMLIEYIFDGNVYPEKLTISVNPSSNNGACNGGMFSYVHVRFFNEANNVLYPNSGITAIDNLSGSAGVYTDRVFDFSTINAFSQPFALNTLQPAKMDVLIGSFCQVIGAPSRTLKITSNAIKFEYTSVDTPLIRPLLDSDEVEFTEQTDPPFFSPYVLARGAGGGLPVHAPADAVVMGITPLSLPQCRSFGIDDCYADVYAVDLSSSYVVALRLIDDESELLYVVDNAPAYLKNEATITGGCVMGNTIRTNNPTVGVALATRGQANLLDRYTLAPSANAPPCVEEENIVCEGGESRMNLVWLGAQKSAGVVYDQTVITIPAGGRMFALLALPVDQRVYAEIVVAGQSLVAQFGTRVETKTLNDQLTTITFGWVYIVPDNGSFSTIEVRNTGTGNLTISDICIAYESNNDPDDPDNPNPPDMPPPPSACYFYNNSFALGDVGWQVNATQMNTPPGGGLVSIGEGGEIAQQVALFLGANPTKSFTLTLVVGLWYTSYVPIPTGDDMELTYSIEDAVYEPIDTITSSQFYESVISNSTITISTNIVIDASIDTNLVIRVGYFGVSPVDGLKGVNIYSTCIAPGDGVWDGYEPPIEGDDGWLEEDCGEIPEVYDTGDVGKNIINAGSRIVNALSYFLGCQLIRATNGIYAQVLSGAVAGVYASNWVGEELVPYVSGYLNNSFNFGANGVGFDASGLTDIFETIGTMPSNFFELLLWVITSFFGILIRIIQGLGTIFSSIIEFINSIINIGNEIISAWNNTVAASMPGIDDCQTLPETKTRCVTFWMMENTILGQPYGVLIIPLIVSALTIIALLNLFVQVRQLIGRVSSSI